MSVDTAIVRIFNTFGPRMRPDDGRAIPTFIRQALRGEPITVAGDGTQSRSICYVDDLVEGIVRLLHSGETGPVNIGNPHEVSMVDLARWIGELCGSKLRGRVRAAPAGRSDGPPARHHAGSHALGLGACHADRRRSRQDDRVVP